jgi:hypothetical protein
MAEKTPDSIIVESEGSLRKIIATFTTNDIDDDDTWVSGIKSAIDWDVHTSIDGPQDCTIDAYDATTGTFTFGSAANQTGRVTVWCRGY